MKRRKSKPLPRFNKQPAMDPDKVYEYNGYLLTGRQWASIVPPPKETP